MLPAKVQLPTLAVPWMLDMAPPTPTIASASAWLPVKVQLLTLAVAPRFIRPPPKATVAWATAWLPMKVLLLSVSGPTWLKTPPPPAMWPVPSIARLLAKAQPAMVRLGFGPKLAMPPPRPLPKGFAAPPTVWLPVKAELVTVAVPRFISPPPWPNPAASPTAWLPLNVQPVTARVAPTSLRTPPPSPVPRARLPDRTQWFSVKYPATSTPPPWSARPSTMLRWARVAVVPLPMEKTRLTPLPLTVKWPAVGPWTVTASVAANSPPVRAMVPASPGWKSTTSAPGWALAAAIAARSEPAPASARLRTVKVLGRLRSSSASSRGRRPGGRERRADGRRAARAGRPWWELRSHMIGLLGGGGLRYSETGIGPGAQTRRPGDT